MGRPKTTAFLAGYSFDDTIKFICFSAEEWGLYGSKHYAQEAKGKGEKTMGVINLDMLGYTDQIPEDLDVVINYQSDRTSDMFNTLNMDFAVSVTKVSLAVAADLAQPIGWR